MKQTVIVAKPPVYDRCVHAFGAEAIVGRPIIWSWGDKIYNPTDVDIPRELFAHEAVHGARQLDIIEFWWDQYLTNPEFRLQEELLAHRAEWRSHVKYGAAKDLTPAFEGIAARLASPMYGKMISVDGAKFALVARS